MSNTRRNLTRALSLLMVLALTLSLLPAIGQYGIARAAEVSEVEPNDAFATAQVINF